MRAASYGQLGLKLGDDSGKSAPVELVYPTYTLSQEHYRAALKWFTQLRNNP